MVACRPTTMNLICASLSPRGFLGAIKSHQEASAESFVAHTRLMVEGLMHYVLGRFEVILRTVFVLWK